VGAGPDAFDLAPRARLRELVAVALAALALSETARGEARAGSSAPPDSSPPRLAGHLVPALARATPRARAPAAQRPLVLTLVLARDDPAGFEELLADLYDPRSRDFHRFRSARELADRFGPSSEAYESVRSFLQASGFSLIAGSDHRLTITVSGPRALVEETFGVTISDYDLDGRSFYANTGEPSLPAGIASRVLAIVGLADLAQPRSLDKLVNCVKNKGGLACFKNFAGDVWNAYQNTNCATRMAAILVIFLIVLLLLAETFLFAATFAAQMNAIYALIYAEALACLPIPSLPFGPVPGERRRAARGMPGAGQRVGVVAFDTFNRSDVENFLALNAYPADTIDQVTEVDVNGGAPAVGLGETEVLLDLAVILTVAKGAQVTLYSAPLGTSFQTVVSRMIDDGVDVISNSWAYCEDQTSLADVTSLDALFATAAAVGISVFNASGDGGATCLDGSPNTVHVPSSSPHATAVGGAKVVLDDDLVFQQASWWSDPATGAGGFGTSRYFPRPSYQDGLNGSSFRSVPDLVAAADPAENGLGFCQESKGGCPSGLLVGGTSMAAPIWAGFAALLNAARGENLGFLNPALYGLADSAAFHSPTSLGSDFAHVGLGLAKLAQLHLALEGLAPGPADAAQSVVAVDPPDVAVGDLGGRVIVQLRDANGTFVPGKTVALEASGGGVEIDPPSAVSSDADGTAVFTISHDAYEEVTFTVHDTTDGVTLAQTGTARFVAPPPTAGGIVAFPTSVPANGTSTSTITVTLEDGSGNGTPGKAVALSQGSGRSLIAGPTPAVTDASGQVQFTVSSGIAETVTYTAVDLTDGYLAVPGQATVEFSGSSTSCAEDAVGAGAGYAIAPFARAFEAGNFSYGNVNWGGCPGASQPAFHPGGSVYVADARTGELFRLDAAGGTVNDDDVLSNLGPTIAYPVIGKDGRIYAAHGSTGGNWDTGNVVEIDRDTGAVVRVLASNLKCPANLAVDPLTGDLFFTHVCFGAGADDAALHRISDPAGAPALSTYVTLPATPNGAIAFAPDGTLYVVTGYTGATPPILEIAGTDQPQPPAVTPLAGVHSYFFVTVAEALADGSAKSLVTHFDLELRLVDISEEPFVTSQLADAAISTGVVGPDGCLYPTGSDTVYRLSEADGSCPFLPTSPAPTLTLSPAPVAPNGTQGEAQLFQARLRNVTNPEWTPVVFGVTGANSGFGMSKTDADGVAALNLVGVFAGTDGVSAAATVDGLDLVSNRSQISWGAGRHVTELSLDASPESGFVGAVSTLTADLVDLALEPHAALAGATIEFSVGGESCQDATDGAGRASCEVTFDAPGEFTLVASYDGDLANLGASASAAFTVGEFGGSSLIFADDFETGNSDAWSGTFAPGAKIFADGFETGNAVLWSASVPPD
jgi:hypothetical protein